MAFTSPEVGGGARSDFELSSFGAKPNVIAIGEEANPTCGRRRKCRHIRYNLVAQGLSVSRRQASSRRKWISFHDGSSCRHAAVT